jgi:hypothetical protein
VAELVDDLIVRPGFLAGGAWLFRGSAAGMWAGFALGKLAADSVWYGVEAAARRTARHGCDLLQSATARGERELGWELPCTADVSACSRG